MAFNRVPPISPRRLQQQDPQPEQIPARQGGQSRRPAYAAPDELPRRTGRGGRSPEPSSTASGTRRTTLTAPSTSTAGASRHPAQRRAPEEFPARQLKELLAECRMLPGGLLSAPPPSIEALSAHERGQLETALMHRFMEGSHNMHATTADGEVANLPPVPPPALAAMQTWLMVQSARLRHVDHTIVERIATQSFCITFSTPAAP